MRPGQLRPGNKGRGGEDIWRLTASMRPGQLRPGNAGCWRCCWSAGSAGFNEAGAASPRKCGEQNPVLQEFRRFNEAGAASPRKCARAVEPRRLHRAASMRPGQLRPGNLSYPSNQCRIRTASMRPGQLRPGNSPGAAARRPGPPCFNEAGAASPRKFTNRGVRFALVAPCFNEAGAASPRKLDGDGADYNQTLSASMRPGQLRPGDDEARDRGAVLVDASMRPGQLRPGDVASLCPCGAEIKASMRPGQLRPGDTETALIRSSRAGPALQ